LKTQGMCSFLQRAHCSSDSFKNTHLDLIWLHDMHLVLLRVLNESRIEGGKMH
jgi:hypothetical protein